MGQQARAAAPPTRAADSAPPPDKYDIKAGTRRAGCTHRKLRPQYTVRYHFIGSGSWQGSKGRRGSSGNFAHAL